MRVEEERHRVAGPARPVDDSVRCGQEPAVAPLVQHVADVDDEGAVQWRYVDPVAVRGANRQATCVVLSEEREAPEVSVWCGTKHTVCAVWWLGWGVEQAGRGDRAGEMLHDRGRIGVKGFGGDAHHLAAEPTHGLVVRHHRGFKPAQVWPLVLTGQVVAGPYFSRVGRMFTHGNERL